ncbi:hypothetical protein QBC47DRAFT_418534 [Echria macrotheca]|uniref:Adenine deaminase n=1 Tax=Echria macrotheca TaxID=438768 RepID=A0AAJ0B2H5_9PEZI|nr:hypothetical protein QBC47DRAFT_418534 [Echria macrotheca]
MCKSPLHDLLVNLPKCEHHVHLEGTLSPSLLFSLAAKNNIVLRDPSSPAPATTSPNGGEEGEAFTSPAHLAARYANFSSLDDFLAYYYVGFSVLRDADDFEALTYEYLVRAAQDNVRHAEVFFDPQGHLPRGVSVEVVMEGFGRAVRRAEAEGLGISVLLIPCLLRHLPVEHSAQVFDSLVRDGHFASGALSGLGLCSTEIDRPPELYRAIFERAKEHGTAHAGEEGPPAYIASALSELSVSRIDHGVRAAQSAELLALLAAQKILLTVCPLSNLALRGVQRVADVPIRAFIDAGVRFSINSDDPAYFGGYILDNYCAVQEAFGLSVGEWEGIARAAVEGSWCVEGRKGEILRELEGVLVEFGGVSG